MINPQLMGCNIENGPTPQKLPEKLPISGKRKRKIMLKLRKRKVKNFSKTTKVDESESQYNQSRQSQSNTSSARKCLAARKLAEN